MITEPQHFCRTITLTDEPEETDAFSGPHQRIAQAVADLIQPPDAKGIAIGIEGSWGSGKSTVARMLIKRLEPDKDIAVVSFDVWAHEGDPLRRTFLETLIRTLQALPHWVDAKVWEDRIEQLANRREVVKTKDNLTVTGWGKFVAFTLLLVPLGSALVTAALRENVMLYGGPPAQKFLFLLLVGLLLTFSPLIVLVIRRKKQQDILGFLFNKGPTERTTETSRTVNPTSIEFEESFKKLIEEAIGNNQRRIVLILDNLDRVDSQDALTIWSTLQTFFQHKSTSQLSWRDRLWLIVLYDIRGLSQLWENAGNKSEAKTAVSFIDKSFQIRFEVPALVPSDWRQFLMVQLAKALPDHNEAELHEVYRILAIWVAEKNKVPTIRELKLFVNQIGAVHRQWAGPDHTRDTFPLALIAYYVLLRRDGVDVVTALFNPEFPGKEYLDVLGGRAHEHLAGLDFNVEVDVAQQLLFSNKIKNALTLGSAAELKTVASLLPRGFWEIFERIAREWASTEFVKVSDAAWALEESGILSNGFGPSVRLVTQCFCERAATVQAWAPIDVDRAKGLAVLLNWNGSLRNSSEHEKFIQTLFQAIALGLIHSESVLPPKDWLECVNLIIGGLDRTIRQMSLTTVVNTLVNHLRTHGPLPSHYQAFVLEVLSELRESPEIAESVEEHLRQLVDSKTLAIQFVKDEEKSSSTVAWMVYTMMRYGSSIDGLLGQGKSKAEMAQELNSLFSPPRVEAFVAILERYRQTALLFSLFQISPDFKPLVVDSLRMALNSSDAKDLFTGNDAFDRLEFVFSELGSSDEEDVVLAKLFSEVQTQLDLIEELRHRLLKEANANLYLLILKSNNGRRKEFANWCVNFLRTVKPDTWSSSIHFGKPLIRLALYLNEIGVEVDLGENYSVGLTTVVETLKHVEWHSRLPVDVNLVALIGSVESPSRRAFQDLLANLIKNDTALATWFFRVFALELRTELLYSSRGQDVISLFEVILNNQNPSGLEWLRDTLARSAKELQSKYSNEPVWKNFEAAMMRCLSDHKGPKHMSALNESIARILNVKGPASGLIPS